MVWTGVNILATGPIQPYRGLVLSMSRNEGMNLDVDCNTWFVWQINWYIINCIISEQYIDLCSGTELEIKTKSMVSHHLPAASNSWLQIQMINIYYFISKSLWEYEETQLGVEISALSQILPKFPGLRHNSS